MVSCIPSVPSVIFVLTLVPLALHFDPDRFVDERLNKYFTGNPFIFLPFNAGPRICLGQQVRFVDHTDVAG